MESLTVWWCVCGVWRAPCALVRKCTYDLCLVQIRVFQTFIALFARSHRWRVRNGTGKRRTISFCVAICECFGCLDAGWLCGAWIRVDIGPCDVIHAYGFSVEEKKSFYGTSLKHKWPIWDMLLRCLRFMRTGTGNVASIYSWLAHTFLHVFDLIASGTLNFWLLMNLCRNKSIARAVSMHLKITENVIK